jgi:hypothetical protein
LLSSPGRAASSLFWSNDDAFRKKFPEIAERNDLYRSMASAQARYLGYQINQALARMQTIFQVQFL